MSETYAALIREWRVAAAATRNAQAKLKAQFEGHLDGGPEPLEDDVRRLRELREVESRKLDQAMQYIKKTARGPKTGMGNLE